MIYHKVLLACQAIAAGSLVMMACQRGAARDGATDSAGRPVPPRAESAAVASDGRDAPGANEAGDPPATAGSPVVAEFFGAAELAHVADSVARVGSTGHMLRAHPQFEPIVMRRTRDGS